jgi:hypothetical protein
MLRRRRTRRLFLPTFLELNRIYVSVFGVAESDIAAFRKNTHRLKGFP